MSALSSGQDSFQDSCSDDLGKNVWWHAVKRTTVSKNLSAGPCCREPPLLCNFQTSLNHTNVL